MTYTPKQHNGHKDPGGWSRKAPHHGQMARGETAQMPAAAKGTGNSGPLCCTGTPS
eukprot:NODE_7123_length_587_cov_3.241636_g6123_i0.p4 GENE.NODE_7123_length_587_cov_3.241636_g6123_i0~~NODE_7123_length_587_cov_3.241636_g6123_i0.p4  ORF type:complete len:56 (-),score=0.40 NODE_7123_length_587_cov_3.241636_g6123_i0:349-516(-)